ncbi:MAG: hypothetical protein WA213_11545 [Terriglobales bacterium]
MSGDWLKAERAFVFDLDVSDWMQPVPESAAGDNESDKNADDEEETVGGQRDEEESHYDDGCDQSGGALQAEA